MGLHLNFLQKHQWQNPQRRYPRHHLPNRWHTIRKRDSDFSSERFRKVTNLWDGSIGDFEPCGKAGDKFCWEFFLELILEDGAWDGDTPRLQKSNNDQCQEWELIVRDKVLEQMILWMNRMRGQVQLIGQRVVQGRGKLEQKTVKKKSVRIIIE